MNQKTNSLLTHEQKTNLSALLDQIEKSEKKLEVLKELGLGVNDLSDKLAWAKKRATTLLDKG